LVHGGGCLPTPNQRINSRGEGGHQESRGKENKGNGLPENAKGGKANGQRMLWERGSKKKLLKKKKSGDIRGGDKDGRVTRTKENLQKAIRRSRSFQRKIGKSKQKARDKKPHWLAGFF